jgi:FkbM family methyltransferase
MRAWQAVLQAGGRIRPHFPQLGARLQLAAERRIYEPEVNLLPALVARDKIAIDIGANRGGYTGALLPLCRGVEAFEPNPVVAVELRRSWPKAQVHVCALGDEAGTATLRMPATAAGRALTGHASLTTAMTFENEQTVDVPVKTLDSFGFTNVGFIKIDVEGFEMQAIRGGIETIKRDRPNMLIESQDSHASGQPYELVAFLADLGYAASFFNQGRIHPFADWSPDMIGWHDAPVNNFIFRPT